MLPWLRRGLCHGFKTNKKNICKKTGHIISQLLLFGVKALRGDYGGSPEVQGERDIFKGNLMKGNLV